MGQIDSRPGMYYEELLEVVPALVPGLARATLLYFDNTVSGVRGLQYDFKADNVKKRWMDLRHFEQAVEMARAENKAFDWFQESELPFAEQKPVAGQIDIFSALQKDVLRIALDDPGDGQKDLLFLHLSGVKDARQVKGIRRSLDQSARDYIGLMASRTISHLLGRIHGIDESRDMFLRQTRSSFRRFVKERTEFKRTEERYSESLIRLAQSHLKEASVKLGYDFILSDDVLNEIKSYPGDLSTLLKRIDQAAHYALQLYRGSRESEVVIHDWFLDLEPAIAHETATEEPGVAESKSKGSLSRTMELLDKLEDAARLVEKKSLKLTSANVGSLCPSPISAPAITDSIRNHKARIIHVLGKYPERWSVIRTRFRPILNVLENNAIREKASA